MSHTFTRCFRTYSRKHDNNDYAEIPTQSSIEERFEPTSCFATKAKPSKRHLGKSRTTGPLRKRCRGDEKHSIEEQSQHMLDRGVSIEAHGPHLDRDPFVNSDYVFGLPTTASVEDNYNLYHQFLDSKDAAMVFFYNPEFTRSGIVRLRFQKAAMETNKPNHAYAAVNCSELPDICAMEGVDAVPLFRLYSRGKLMGEYDDRSITAEDLQRFVETLPHYSKLRPPAKIKEV